MVTFSIAALLCIVYTGKVDWLVELKMIICIHEVEVYLQI